MLLIDNGVSVLQQIGTEGDSLEIVLKDSSIYGETEATDCPFENYCDTYTMDSCIDKYGAQIPYVSTAGKDIFPTSPSSLPLKKIKSDASYGGSSLY